MNAPDRPNVDYKQDDLDRKGAIADREADEDITWGEFNISDVIEAIEHANVIEKAHLCKYIGSDNCSAGIELHRMLRNELARRKMGE